MNNIFKEIYSNLKTIEDFNNNDIFENKLFEISDELKEIVNLINDLKNDNNTFISKYIKEKEINKKTLDKLLPFLIYQHFIENSTSVDQV